MARTWARIAHRGASGSAPELTPAAIRRALEIGVDMIEVDLQVSRDGHLVVIHDETLDRTTSGTGLVREHSWAEICELDAGTWFAEEYASERVLDLPSLLQMVAGAAHLNVEIKAPAADWPVLVPALGRELHAHGVSEETIISCFDLDALRFVRREIPDAVIGVLWYDPDLARGWQAVDELRARSLHLYEGTTTRDALQAARERGIESHIWTVNDVATMKRLLDWGACGIMSDHPELFADLRTDEDSPRDGVVRS